MRNTARKEQESAAWEHELMGLLTDLVSAQEELLALEDQRRRRLAANDGDEGSIAPRARALAKRLEAYEKRRRAISAWAAQAARSATAGLPAYRSGSWLLRLASGEPLDHWVSAQTALVETSQSLATALARRKKAAGGGTVAAEVP